MENQIKKFVEIYFENIPYSSENAAVWEKIEESLIREYKKLSENMSENEAFEALLGKYGRFSDMAKLAGCSAEEIQKFQSSNNIIHLKQLKKEIAKQRRRIYGFAIFSVFGFVQMLWFILTLFVHPTSAIWNVIYAVIMFAFAYILIIDFKKTEKKSSEYKYDNASFVWLRDMSDKFIKRKLNYNLFLISTLLIILFAELNFFISTNSKPLEFVENIFNGIIVFEVPAYLYIKNFLCFKMFHRRVNSQKKEKYKKHLIGTAIFSICYWSAAILLIIIFRNILQYPVNAIIVPITFFLILTAIYILKFRKKIVYKNIVVNKPRVAVLTAVVTITSGFSFLQKDTWYTQPYINSVPIVEHNSNNIKYDDETGIYTITASDDDFKILHLTDIHIGGSLYSYNKDIKALKACYAEIKYTHPDLVVVTGDLCFPMGVMSMSLNNSAPVNQFAAFMRNTGVPWCFTYGNHDTESIATSNQNELDEIYKSLSYKTSGTLLYPYIQPDITGRSNQLIEIRNADETLNTALFLIDSNAYTGEKINVYDYIHDDQVEWYADEINRLNGEEGRIVNSLVFFHIPLQQYRTAYQLYENGRDEVKYFFGENNEKMIDKVCCSNFPSSLFDRMIELKSTTGTFCGHDHYNNISLEYKGIRLTYGMSIDYLAMPGIEHDHQQRGAELITLHSDSSWDLEQIPLDSIMNVLP